MWREEQQERRLKQDELDKERRRQEYLRLKMEFE